MPMGSEAMVLPLRASSSTSTDRARRACASASEGSACSFTSPRGDRISGIPDKVLRPARKEVNVKNIGAQMKYKDKGYATVEPLSAPNE